MTVIELVGPKGYIHGWIFVGAPGTGAHVSHPQFGGGTVTSHDGKHVTVKFSKTGTVHTFAAHTGTGARLEQSPPDSIGTLRGYYGSKLDSDGSDWAARHAKDLTRIFPPEIHQMLAKRGVRLSLGEGPVTQYRKDLIGVHPRGWGDKTWADVPGVGGGTHTVLGDTAEHGASNLAGHEMSHTIDKMTGNPSGFPQFRAAYAKVATGDGVNPYFLQTGDAGPSEMFAEAFGVWMDHRSEPAAAREKAMSEALSRPGGWLPGMASLDRFFGGLSAALSHLATAAT